MADKTTIWPGAAKYFFKEQWIMNDYITVANNHDWLPETHGPHTIMNN